MTGLGWGARRRSPQTPNRKAFGFLVRGAGLWVLTLWAAAACAEKPQVGVLGADDLAQARQVHTTAAHIHYDSTMDLPSDDQLVEPEQPFVATLEQRLLAHLHTPSGVCSGVMLDPKLVATAHQCVEGESQGAKKLSGEWRVEVASGSLAWTARQASAVVAPGCRWDKLDIAILVLAEPAAWVKPLPVGTVPEPGGRVQAVGFGHCRGEARGIRDKAGSVVSVDSDAFVIDVGLCKGDVGGFVVDSGGNLVGVVSHQDDPDNSPRRTTTSYRVDTSVVRALMGQAKEVAAGGDVGKMKAVPCE